MPLDDKLEQDYLEALHRLRSGIPTTPLLIKRQEAGRLKITPRSVALEARRSHTPLYRSHQHVRERIEATAIDRAKTLCDASQANSLLQLKKLIRQLQSERDLLATQNTALTLKVQELNRQLLREKRHRNEALPFGTRPG